jgi:CRP/FNR family nitrogen fixation transcriptional regulator
MISAAASSKSPARPILADGEEHSLAGVFEMLGAPMSFRRNVEVFGEGEPADHFYKVASGAVRTYKVLSDGRRQIGAFYLPGDLFGLEEGADHSFSAEAVVTSTVRVVRRNVVMAAAGRDNAIAADLWSATAMGLRRAQDHMLVLGRQTAEERVASFLLSMNGVAPRANDIIELPMSRQDIADYLGLTISTVSRTFTHLESTSAIELVSTRRVALRNRGNLQRLNS